MRALSARFSGPEGGISAGSGNFSSRYSKIATEPATHFGLAYAGDGDALFSEVAHAASSLRGRNRGRNTSSSSVSSRLNSVKTTGHSGKERNVAIASFHVG